MFVCTCLCRTESFGVRLWPTFRTLRRGRRWLPVPRSVRESVASRAILDRRIWDCDPNLKRLSEFSSGFPLSRKQWKLLDRTQNTYRLRIDECDTPSCALLRTAAGDFL